MAGNRTKDLRKVSITITAENGKRRTLTSLYDYEVNPPEVVEKRDGSLNGDVWLRKKADKSSDLKITVKAGSEDERFLDKLMIDELGFDAIIIDETAKRNPKQYTCKESEFVKLPDDSVREIDNRTYDIIVSDFKLEQL